MISILIYHVILLAQLFIVCRNKTVSIKELLQTFVVGSTIAVIGNFIIQGIFAKFISSDIILFTVGPMSEELFKISFVVFLLFKTPLAKTATVEDGVLLGAAAGAGFGMTEDVVRAVGKGFDFMIQNFPGYNLANLPRILTSWLPSERSFTSIVGGQFVPGHLIWTALVGLGFGLAIYLKDKKWRFVVPLILLGWVIIDHSLTNNSDSVIKFLYPLYLQGMGIRYALTILLFIVVYLDERQINLFLPKEKFLLIPGEKTRSLLGELGMTISHLRFGWLHWKYLMTFFRLRRQLAMNVAAGEKNESLQNILSLQRKCVIGTIRFKGNHNNISENIALIWQGPAPIFNKMSLIEKIQILAIVVAGISGLFITWLFFFSVYLPPIVTRLVINSPVLPVLGVLGYLVAVYQLIEFYRKKQWKMSFSQDDRISAYSQPLLVHSSGLTILMFVPGFFGSEHPLLNSKFFWGQFKTFWNELGPGRKWVGGTISAGIGFIPIVGNIKSGIDAAIGYDYITDEEVAGIDRVIAGVGAVPLVGNLMRGVTYGQKLSKFVKLRKTVEYLEDVDNLAGKVGLGQAAKDDLVHAFGELRKELEPLSVPKAHEFAQRRENMVQKWHESGRLESNSRGVYSLPVSGKSVEVYMGKEGLDKLGFRINTDHVGQVSIDHQNKSIMFDGINKNSGEGTNDLSSVTKGLTEKFPDYTIMDRQVMKDGFSVYDVTSPGGKKSQFYTVPTHSTGQVSSVGSR